MTPSLKPVTGAGSTYATRAYVSPRSGADSGTTGANTSGSLARIGPDTFQPSVPVSKGHAPRAQATPGPRKSDSLVAARVSAGIDFSAGPEASSSASQTAAQTIPLYRHPADRNTVATAVHAGRILDVNG
jgi:hypothetical protein